MNQISVDLSLYQACTLCPRHCKADRTAGQLGRCHVPQTVTVARAALHFWEEPCISGETGSGAVFFSGCSLGCVFCQNHSIASAAAGRQISVERLAEIFLELQAKGAVNINLVTPTHYAPSIAAAIRAAKKSGLFLPIVYNSSGYESVETLRLLDGLVDIYLPDFKYMDSTLSLRYSHAADYADVAKLALAEMFRQVGKPKFLPVGEVPCPPSPGQNYPSPGQDSPAHAAGQPSAGCGDEPAFFTGQPSAECGDEPDPLMKKGIIVRHLALPGCGNDSRAVLRYLYETYGDNIYISIMNQYTPLPHVASFPELNRRLTDQEYDSLVDDAIEMGIENGFIQEGETASESFIPEFDCEGV